MTSLLKNTVYVSIYTNINGRFFCGAALSSAWAVAIPEKFQRLSDPDLPGLNFIDNFFLAVSEHLADPVGLFFQRDPEFFV